MANKGRVIVTLAAASQAGFPSLITSNQMTDRFWKFVSATGADIYCTTTAGVKLKRELVSIDKTAETMELYVRTPESATTIYLYYGDYSLTETNDLDTWNASYVGCWHMNDNPDTSTIQDSTVSNIDGTKRGAGTPAETTGAFTGDKAQDFDGAADYITLAAGLEALLNNDQQGTISFVVERDAVAANQYIFNYTDIADSNRFSAIYLSNGNKLVWIYRNNTNTAGDDYMSLTGNTTLLSATSTFYHCAVTSDGSTTKIYVNGILQAVTTSGNNIGQWFGDMVAPTANYTSLLGKQQWSGGSANYHKGLISEFRINSGTARPVAWLLAEYNSLLNNAAFATGAEDWDYYWTLKHPAIVRPKHVIEVRDDNGILQGVFKDVAEATLDQSTNNPAILRLTCPLSAQTSTLLTYLQRPYEIWAHRDDDLLFTGPINLRDDSHGKVTTLHLDVMDYLQSLKQEFVETYDANDDIEGHVDAWLAMQVNVRPVLLGTIEPVLTRDLTIEQAYIYESIMNLRNTNVGGYVQVDPYRKINWYNQLSESTGQQIRYRKNLVGMKRTWDWLNFGNRLYIYGDGIDLTDAGYATTYIEDAESIATYGLSIRKYIEPLSTIAKPDILLDYANYKLKQSSNPKMSYTVDIVNLADYGRTFEDLSLGSWVRLIDEELDIDLDVQIVRVVYDLVKGQNIQIELSASPSSIIDFDIGAYY